MEEVAHTQPVSVPLADHTTITPEELAKLPRTPKPRLRWPRALLGGLITAAVGTLLGWLFCPVTYVAAGQILIKSHLTPVLFPEAVEQINDYDAFIQTQMIFLQRDEVIRRAIFSPPWRAAVPPVKSFAEEMQQFKESLQILHPAQTEIMQVEFSSTDPKIAQLGADAVINAYRDLSEGFIPDNFDERMKRLNEEQKKWLAVVKDLEQRIELSSHGLGPDLLQRLAGAMLLEMIRVGAQLSSLEFETLARTRVSATSPALAESSGQINYLREQQKVLTRELADLSTKRATIESLQHEKQTADAFLQKINDAIVKGNIERPLSTIDRRLTTYSAADGVKTSPLALAMAIGGTCGFLLGALVTFLACSRNARSAAQPKSEKEVAPPDNLTPPPATAPTASE